MDQNGQSKILSAIDELSALTGSFKTGISDREAQRFVKTASELKQMLLDRNGPGPVGKIILSLGKFLAANQSMDHQATFSLLEKQLDTLSTLTADGISDPAAQDRLVREMIEDFKAFKERISPSAPDPEDLEELKVVVLSIDWEITNETINQFNEICGHLLQKWKDRSNHLNLLKMMKSLVNYIGSKKADAHADSIDFLKSVYTALETMVYDPQLNASDKKQLYNQAIERFNRFKEMAASPRKQGGPSGRQAHSEIRQDLPPALSHLGQSKKPVDEAASELTLLDPDEAVVRSVSRNQAGEDDIQPALQGKRGVSQKPANVMDDLLNPKETEADKMLETIHLMDVGGANPIHNPAAMAGGSEELKPGMSNITPSEKGSKPIPEIEQTLDAFFNLDTVSEAGSEQDSTTSQEVAVPQHSADTGTDGMVPVEERSLSSDQAVPPGEADLAVIGQLEEAFGRLPEDLGEDGRKGVLNDLDKLKAKWMDDPLKSKLVNLIGILFNRLSAAELEQVPAPKKGVLSKLKRFFSS